MRVSGSLQNASPTAMGINGRLNIASRRARPTSNGKRSCPSSHATSACAGVAYVGQLYCLCIRCTTRGANTQIIKDDAKQGLEVSNRSSIHQQSDASGVVNASRTIVKEELFGHNALHNDLLHEERHFC